MLTQRIEVNLKNIVILWNVVVIILSLAEVRSARAWRERCAQTTNMEPLLGTWCAHNLEVRVWKQAICFKIIQILVA